MKRSDWRDPIRVLCALTGLTGLAALLCAFFGAQAAVRVLFIVGVALAAGLVTLLLRALWRDGKRTSRRHHDS